MRYKILLLCLPLWAEATDTLGHTWVHANFKPKTTDEQYLQVSVLSGDEIIKSGATDLGELLLTEPGITIVADPALQTRYIEMNGLGAEHIKIIVDGIPLSGTVSGKVNIDDIPIQHIEQIEIIRSPMSAEHGSSIGGVINITTARKIEGWSYRLQERLEYPLYTATSADAAYHKNQQNFALEADWSKRDLIENSDTRNPLRNEKSIYSLGARYRYEGESFHPGFIYRYSRDQVQKLGGLQPDSDPSNMVFDPDEGVWVAGDSLANDVEYITHRHLGMFNLPYFINEQNELRLELSTDLWSRESKHKVFRYSEEKSTAKEGGTESNYGAYRMAAKYSNSAIDKMTLNMGVLSDYTFADGERIKAGNQSLSSGALFLGVEYSLTSKLQMATSHRMEWNEKSVVEVVSKTPWIPSLSLKYNLSPNTNLRVNYAKGYRAPNLQELYFSYHDGGSHDIDGNENLKPETSDHISVGMDLQDLKDHLGFKSSLNLFWNSVNDKIIIADNPDVVGYSKYFNISSIETAGIEWSWKQYLGKYLNLSLIPHLNATTKVNEAGIATEEWYMGRSMTTKVNFNFNEFQWNLIYKWMDKEKQYAQEEGEWKENEIESWHWLASSMGYQLEIFGVQLGCTLGVKNILDVKSLDVIGDQISSGHSSGTEQNFAYGRIYFSSIKVQF